MASGFEIRTRIGVHEGRTWAFLCGVMFSGATDRLDDRAALHAPGSSSQASDLARAAFRQIYDYGFSGTHQDGTIETR